MLRISYNIIKAVVTIALVLTVAVIAYIYIVDDYSVYIVKSDSMKPVFASGDLLVIGEPGAPLVPDIATGQIVSFQRNSEFVTHRIVAIDGNIVHTKGDAMEDIDPWTVSSLADIQGCYLFRIPYIGLVSVFLKTKVGWFVCVILPALCLVAFLIKDIVKEVRQRYI
jgi:signal peptidase